MTDEVQQPANEQQDWLETDDENAMRAAIFESRDREEVLVPVPQWKMKILVRAMSGTQQYEYEVAQAQYGSMENKAALYKHLAFKAVQMTALHPKTRKPIFKENDQGTLLDDKNGAIIDMLFGVALRISKIDRESREAARKNLAVVLRSFGTSKSQND